MVVKTEHEVVFQFKRRNRAALENGIEMGQRNITELFRQHPIFIPARLKVCAYVRVSTDHREQLNSLQNQIQYYERLISSNPDYE